MGSVAQWLAHWVVVPGVAGSSPVAPPRRSAQFVACSLWRAMAACVSEGVLQLTTSAELPSCERQDPGVLQPTKSVGLPSNAKNETGVPQRKSRRNSLAAQPAPVAQLDRASAFGAGGWGFKSLRAYSGRGARSILAPLPEYIWSLRNPLEFATIKPANSQAVLRTTAGGGRPGVIKSLRA